MSQPQAKPKSQKYNDFIDAFLVALIVLLIGTIIPSAFYIRSTKTQMVKEEVEYDMKIDEKIRSKVKLEGIEYEVFLYKNTIVPDRELLEKSMIDERARLKLKITAEAKKGKYASAEINRLKDIEGQLNQKIVAESNAIRSIPVTNQLSNDDLVNLRRELELSKSKLTQKEKEYATVKPDC